VPRDDEPHATHHVFFRGNARMALFERDEEFESSLGRLGKVALARGWAVYLFCWMTNHAHVVLSTRDGDLSAGMRDWLSLLARDFNRARNRDGRVLGAPFGSRRVRRDEHLLELARYLPLNTVRARLCRRPEDWRWSSYAATLGLVDPPPFLVADHVLELFGRRRDAARAAYRAFVEAGLPSAAGGSSPLAGLVRGLDDLEGIRLAREALGCSIRDIAAHLGVHHSVVARRLRPRRR
jgi:REP element-mobilizing transposase RayT